MKTPLFLLSLTLCAGVARAQEAPKIMIGQIQTTERKNLGGQVMQSKNLLFTDLKALGTWASKDRNGRRGYVFVDFTDEAQRAKWADKKLVVSLNGKLSDVGRIQNWPSGETALVIDNPSAETTDLLRAGNFYAPASEQLDVRWQLLKNAKLRLTLTKRGAGDLRLAPDNSQIRVRAIRNGEPLKTRAIQTTKRAQMPKNFEILGDRAIWQRDYELNRYADLSQPGRYQVEVDYQLPAQNGGAPDGALLNFAKTFEINVATK